jgi:hypothetical protein
VYAYSTHIYKLHDEHTLIRSVQVLDVYTVVAKRCCSYAHAGCTLQIQVSTSVPLQHMQALAHVVIYGYTVYTHDIRMVAVSESSSSSERLYLHFSM